MTAFQIQGRGVGDGEPVYVIAEAGVNHNGDLAAALALVDAAADSGADAVKFQTFDPAALVDEDAPQATYQRERAPAKDQRAMLERLRLPAADFWRLAKHAAARGITFLSTPFDDGSADLLESLDVAAYKVGSGDLTNLPFLARLASKGRPIILSTGMADLAEIAAAVQTIRASGASDVALLHCVSSYPTPVGQANLRALDTLRAAHPDTVVGYSDHCLGIEVSLAAVARDARIVERHLTLDRTLPGPDQAVSLAPSELAELVQRIRELEPALGDGVKKPQAAELNVMTVARRSLVAARGLRAGERLDAEAVAAKRPGGGLEPARLPDLIGRRLARDVAAGSQLAEQDFA